MLLICRAQLALQSNANASLNLRSMRADLIERKHKLQCSYKQEETSCEPILLQQNSELIDLEMIYSNFSFLDLLTIKSYL